MLQGHSPVISHSSVFSNLLLATTPAWPTQALVPLLRPMHPSLTDWPTDIDFGGTCSIFILRGGSRSKRWCLFNVQDQYRGLRDTSSFPGILCPLLLALRKYVGYENLGLYHYTLQTLALTSLPRSQIKKGVCQCPFSEETWILCSLLLALREYVEYDTI